jgi:hypothetical protein
MTSPEWEAANEDDSDRFPQTSQESAQISTASAEQGSPAPVDPMRSEAARVARYAEAMHASTCRRKVDPKDCPFDGNLAWDWWAEAVVAVADEERAPLVAEVERLRSASDLMANSYARLSNEVFAAEQRAEAAEAKVAALEADLSIWKPRPPKCPHCGDTTVGHNSEHLLSGPRWTCDAPAQQQARS